MTTMPHWLTKQAELSPHVKAIETPQGEVETFRSLQERSEAFARKMAHLGIKKGDHIGVFATNSTSMIVCIHALSYLGAVGVFLNIRLTAHELMYQIKDADVTYVLTNQQDDERVEELEKHIPVYDFSHVNKQPTKQIDVQSEIHLNDVYTIMYTSGTTGAPKGVMHTYGNHWWSAVGSALNLKLHESDKWAAPLPLFHVGGFSICMRSVIYGMPIYLLEKFSVEEMHEAILHKHVTIASVVTIMAEKLLKKLGENTYPETFRCMLLGGGAAPKSLLEQGKKRQVPIVQTYGLTETSSQFATLQSSDAMRKIGSSGKPLFPGQLKIMTPDNQGIGEIIVKGPMVTNGYYQKEAISKRAIQEGWLYTGDVGRLDDEGFLYVYERRSDLIISGGENIYPSEIEETIKEVPGVAEVTVVGVEDSTWGSVPVACVVSKDKHVTEKYILEAIEPFLASYKVPKRIYFIAETPRNATNKIMRHVLQEEIKKGHIT